MEDKKQKPWSILFLGVMSFIFNFSFALVLFGVNWKRLGKPEKARIPIILGIIGVLLPLVIFPLRELFYSLSYSK